MVDGLGLGLGSLKQLVRPPGFPRRDFGTSRLTGLLTAAGRGDGPPGLTACSSLAGTACLESSTFGR